MKSLAVLMSAVGILASPAAQAGPKPQTYSFSFDGFCDGMTLTITNNLYVVGKSTGCFAGGIEEGIGAVVTNIAPELGTKHKVFVVSSNNFGAGTTATYIINLTQQTWSDFVTSDGVTQTLNHSGTLTFATPSADVTKLPASMAP